MLENATFHETNYNGEIESNREDILFFFFTERFLLLLLFKKKKKALKFEDFFGVCFLSSG